MKFNLSLFFLFFLLSCNANEKNIEKPEVEFENILIEFVTGDEVQVLHRMSVFTDGQKVKVTKEKPYYYYGSETDSTWTTDIGAVEMQLIKKFYI